MLPLPKRLIRSKLRQCVEQEPGCRDGLELLSWVDSVFAEPAWDETKTTVTTKKNNTMAGSKKRAPISVENIM